MMMQVISRAVGLHKLILLNFYPYIQRYIQVLTVDSSIRYYFIVSTKPSKYQHTLLCIFFAQVSSLHKMFW
jgi:hypothetical protein